MIKNTVLIPSYQPGLSLSLLVQKLKKTGFTHIIVVDDGSGEAYRKYFTFCEANGAIIVRHEKNMGKGAALKTGIRAAAEYFPNDTGIVTADGDGQHLTKDILRVSEELSENPGSLVLGVRDFSGRNVPWRSRFGNRFTSFFFRITNGVRLSDTQTGLRGFSSTLYDTLLSIEGDRYEYEMHMLEELADTAPFLEVPIETVYEDNNAGSHFRPVRDSMRVYGKPLRFAASSLLSSVLDILLFWLLLMVLPFPHAMAITAATIAARLFSGVANFLINHYFCFKSSMSLSSTGPRYLILFITQMLLSAGFVTLLSTILTNTVIAKMIVDTLLFFASYQAQKHWVFRKKEVNDERSKPVLQN